MPHPNFINPPTSFIGKGVGGPYNFTSEDGYNPYFPEKNFIISGITRDSSGTPVGSCVVKLFNTATDLKEQQVVSDASGNYSFIVDKTQTYYEIAYIMGVPDRTGATVNTLAGA